jgi:transcriptional antiterminator NusG
MDFGHLHQRWLAVQARVGREFTVAAGIRQRGYRYYLPVYEKLVRRRHAIQSPLFPGYLFVRFDAQNAHPLVKVPDVVRLVGTQTAPTPVQDSEIQALQIACGSGKRCSPFPFMVVGQPVQISSGPLEGIKGFLVRWKNQDRLVLSVDLLRQSVLVEVDLQSVSGLALTA